MLTASSGGRFLCRRRTITSRPPGNVITSTGLLAGIARGRIHFYTMSPDQSFVALATASSDAGQSDRLLSQFYDQSLAAHDDVSSSQLVAALSQETTATATNGTSSFRSTAGGTDDGDSSVGLASRPIPAALGSDRLTELKDLPSAASLAGAAPQTVTVNLIVGIISVAAPKTVRTRWGSSRSLVEVLVGDDTRSGFGVTFWLPPSGPHAFEQSVVAGLRPLDVVLIRNVALHVFMNKVYGSSLRKDLTKIHLLHRRRLDAADFGGHYDSAHIEAAASDPACAAAHPQLDKTSRVRGLASQICWMRVCSYYRRRRKCRRRKRPRAEAVGCAAPS